MYESDKLSGVISKQESFLQLFQRLPYSKQRPWQMETGFEFPAFQWKKHLSPAV
jgi:hypothetical protein